MNQQIWSLGFIAFFTIEYYTNSSFAFKASEIKEIQRGTVGLVCERVSVSGEDVTLIRKERRMKRKERTWKKCDRIRSVLRKKMLGVVYKGKSEEVTEMSEKNELATCYRRNYQRNKEILEILKFQNNIPMSRVCRIQTFNPIDNKGHTWFIIEPKLGEFFFHKPPWTAHFVSTNHFELPDSEFRFDKLIQANVIYFKKLLRLQTLKEKQDTLKVELHTKNTLEDIFKLDDDNLEESKQIDLITDDDSFDNVNDYQEEFKQNNSVIVGNSSENFEMDGEDEKDL